MHLTALPVLEAGIRAVELGCSSAIGDDTLVWLEDEVAWSDRTSAVVQILTVAPETSGGLVGCYPAGTEARTTADHWGTWVVGRVEAREGNGPAVAVDLPRSAVVVV
jgi:hypothetical protein